MRALIIAIIVAIIICTSNAYSCTIQLYAVSEATKLVGTTEKTGNNDGPIVEEILGYIGLKKGNPYCMATVVYCYHNAAKNLGLKDKLPKYGRVSAVWNYAHNNPFKYKIITPQSLKVGTSKIETGDIIIFSRSATDISNFNGHTGIAIEQLSGLYCSVIEGNTGGGKDQGEGDGIWIKKRSLSSKNGNLKLKGFVRIK